MKSHDLQQIIYLIIIISFLLIGIFSQKNLSWQKIIKYLLMWALIGFSIIVIYAYRFEFINFKERINLEINPTSAQINQQGQLVINIADDSHFYITLLVNKTPILFMIDTGASDMMINLDDANKIGINLKKLVFNKAYQTANGRSFGAYVKIREIEISGVKFKDIGASVSQSDMGTSLLGMSFLRRFNKYEFFQDRLVLTF